MTNLIETLREFMTNNVIQSALCIIGTVCGIISIIQAMKCRKRIRYTVARKGDKYVLCFWNASTVTVFKDDVYNFYALVNNEARYSLLYCTDVDLLFNCKLSEELYTSDPRTNKVFSPLFRTLDFVFDFLPTRSGCIIEVDNFSSLTMTHKFVINGRINGGESSSVSTYRWKNTKSMSSHQKIGAVTFDVFKYLMYFLSVAMFIEILLKNQGNSMIACVVLAGLLFAGMVHCRKMMVICMPLKLRQQFRRIRKEKGLEIDYRCYDYRAYVKDER